MEQCQQHQQGELQLVLPVKIKTMTKMKTDQLRCITSTAPLLHQTQENQDNNIKMQCQVLKTNLWIKAIKEEIRNFFKCNVQKKVP